MMVGNFSQCEFDFFSSSEFHAISFFFVCFAPIGSFIRIHVLHRLFSHDGKVRILNRD